MTPNSNPNPQGGLFLGGTFLGEIFPGEVFRGGFSGGNVSGGDFSGQPFLVSISAKFVLFHISYLAIGVEWMVVCVISV